MRTIAIVNQKGGCGKTTTAINLAAIYARRGLRTLLVDMDPQSHCAAGLGVPENRIEFTIGQALLADHANFNPAGLVWEVSRNLHLAPSTMTLASLEAPGGGLHSLPDKDRRLENLLHAISPHYDRCLIDCSPTIGLLTFNALRASRETLIPVETGFFSLRGAGKQWNTIQRLIQHIGRPIACHMLATLHNPDSRLATNILSALRREFAGQILPTVIREHEVLREAASFGQPVLEYAPDSEACRDFEALADWLEEHMVRPNLHIEVLAGASAFQSGPTPILVGEGTNAPVMSSLMGIGAGRGAGATPTPSMPSGMSPMLNPPPLGSRAAELARRVTDDRGRSRSPMDSSNFNQSATDNAIAAAAAASLDDVADAALTPAEAFSLVGKTLVEAIENKAALPPARDDIFGVKRTTSGTLFLQPIGEARTISVAGEFNGWSPDAHPMRRNDDAGVFERIIDLPVGRHQYRLVVDGRWIADPYNPQKIVNTYGEPISLVDVSN